MPTFGAAVDQALVLEHGERLANGVAGDEELGGQVLLAGQPVGVAAGVDLVAQHVGDLTRLVGARPADRRRFGLTTRETRYEPRKPARSAVNRTSAQVN